MKVPVKFHGSYGHRIATKHKIWNKTIFMPDDCYYDVANDSLITSEALMMMVAMFAQIRTLSDYAAMICLDILAQETDKTVAMFLERSKNERS